MKQLLTLITFFSVMQLFGQKQLVWFDVGLKAQYGAAGLYNAAISDSDVYKYKIGNGLSYGGKLGINFHSNGIAIDVMKSSMEQKFSDNAPIPSIKWEGLDIYTLYRNAKNMGYFEIGPKISLVKKVETSLLGTTTETTSNFNKTNIFGVIGFGANILGNDSRFSGILGLRFEYAFTDFVTDHTDNSQYPLPGLYMASGGYKSSNVAFAGVVFELNWGIGYFGKAQCGARSKFIMF